MKLYRYQGINNLERDLEFIGNSKIWTSEFESLNDPSEGLFDLKDLKFGLGILTSLLRKNKSAVDIYCNTINKISLQAKNQSRGVYCLSKVYNSELMWAHYAQGHKGYCIEYDLDLFKIKLPKNCFLPYDNYCFWTEIE
ncbi:DUF2971 domain-containing protein, partial [Chryseobacterium sp. 2TAF14]|uniref:DUF2971 domain-containing protein n=1 Tax=Chryseobacterium sp. 2TAF14 TaxID=3233007 RepID=UPI003F904486